MKNKNILAIDFGGMSVKYFLMKNYEIISKSISNSKLILEWPKLIDDIKENFNKFSKENGEISGIAMSFNSPVIENSRVRWGEINGFWEYKNIKKMLKNAGVMTEENIMILNDAKAACFAESKVGAGKGSDNIAMLTYGTAIGGAAIINGQIVNGEFGLGAELSNPIMGWDGENLSSVKIWCEYGSMTFLQNAYFDETGKKLTGKEIFELSDKNDPIAKKTTTRLLKGVAIHIFNTCYIYGPSKIIIGGGLSNRVGITDEIMHFVKEIEKVRSLKFPAKLVTASLKNEAGAIGAYHYFIENSVL